MKLERVAAGLMGEAHGVIAATMAVLRGSLGAFPVVLSSATPSIESLVNVAEFVREGAQFRQFSYTRLATSAAHLYGRPVASSETWTWLRSAFRTNRNTSHITTGAPAGPIPAGRQRRSIGVSR